MRIVVHDRIDSLSPDIHQRVETFLGQYLGEGTVQMAPTVYRSATSWAIAIDHSDRIVGFAAHRLFTEKRATIVQIMGTFLAPEVRGSLMASTLLQGTIFLRAWLRAPLRPIVWCTRTRVPAVYRTAARFNEIYPKLDDPAANRTVWTAAERVARRVYGDGITLEPDTFVLRNSYGSGSTFLPLRRSRSTPVHDAFAHALRYDRDEAIFLFGPFNRLDILRYLVARTVFQVSNRVTLRAETMQRSLSRHQRRLRRTAFRSTDLGAA